MAILPFTAPAPVAPSVTKLLDYIDGPINDGVPFEDRAFCPDLTDCGSSANVYPATDAHGDTVPGVLCCLSCGNQWPAENSARWEVAA